MMYICKPSRVEAFDNRSLGLTAAQVRARTGCDAIFNGALYNPDRSLCVAVKVDGKWLALESYELEGFGWNSAAITGDETGGRQSLSHFVTAPFTQGSHETGDEGRPKWMTAREGCEYDNFIACVAVTPDVKRGRTAFGMTADGRMAILCVADGAEALTVPRVRAALQEKGCKDVLVLDGGASSQIICPEGEIKSERNVPHYMCIFMDREEKQLEIKKQLWTKSDAVNNSALTPKGIMVHSTATPGVNAQRFHDLWDNPNIGASVHFFLDDRDIIQCLPLNKRAGHAAGTANNSHLAFEICEPTGLTYNKNGSAITVYNPPKGYFNAIWENATWLCAHICEQFGWNPQADGVILSHAEGYKRAVASNHADTGHWFTLEKKTMDDFRREVVRKMEKSEPEVKPGGGASDWAAASCQKAIDKGIFEGDGQGNYNWTEPLTREAFCVVMDRLGLL